jgi:hypothetical protein
VRDGEAGGIAGCCHKGLLVSHKGREWRRQVGDIANAPGRAQAEIMGHSVIWFFGRVVVYCSYADGCRDGDCCCCDGDFDGENETQVL